MALFQSIYVEKDVKSYPMTESFLSRFPNLPLIWIDRYTEVFNRQGQNFRLQKENPSLILAKKHGQKVFETPKGYGIGTKKNFYFSHMMNCIFDCRYCFLQGMYTSSHFVLFVNTEDFEKEIKETIQKYPDESTTFFSGYDCDSLALEPLTHFIEHFLPLFSSFSNTFFELRTKSVQISFLLKHEPLSNLITAFSMTPEKIGRALEHKTPSLQKRIEACRDLQKKGWPIGLRFDPLVYTDDFRSLYQEFFSTVFSSLDPQKIHSVTMGPFRLPKEMHKKMEKLYPEERLFSHSLLLKNRMVTYRQDKEKSLLDFCQKEILSYIPSSRFYPCEAL